MTREEFQKLAESGVILLDGATGSNLRKAGMPVGVSTEAAGAGASAGDSEAADGIRRSGQPDHLCADLFREPDESCNA